MEKPIAIFAGSFDPVTYGHIDIIKRAQKMFGSLVVLVMKNGAKQGLFTPEERMDLLRQAVAEIPGVVVDTADGLLADYARRHQMKILVRALRSCADTPSELSQAHYNKLFNPELETVFLAADPQFQYVSSSAVREIARCGGDLTTLVPSFVQKMLAKKLG